MKRPLMIAAAATAIVVVGLSGCSSKKSSTSGSGSTTTGASATVAGPGGKASKVSIDGKDQNVQGNTVCATTAGQVSIAIGEAATGIGAVLSDANPPEVKSVGLGNVNGVTLGYTAGTGQGNATATKDGNTYKITGTATGVDMANPMQPVNKPFEIEANCSG